MDQKFLMEVTEGYLVNHNVHSDFIPKEVDQIRNKIFEDLSSLPQYLRNLDPKLYEEVYFSNRLHQNKIFETYLNIRYAKQEITDEKQEVLDENALTTGLEWIGRKISPPPTPLEWVGQKISAFASAFVSSPFVQGFGILLALYMLLRHHKSIAKNFFNFLSGFGKFLDWTGKHLIKQGRYFQFRYAVVQKNFESCYQKCGVKEINKQSILNYFNKYSGGKESDKIKDCLTECFVDTNIKLINEHLRLYFMCINQTEDFDSINKMSSSELLYYTKTKSFKKYGLQTTSVCNEYIEVASEYIEKFDDLLNYFYKDTLSKRNVMNRLMKSIVQTRNEVNRMQPKQIQKYKKF